MSDRLNDKQVQRGGYKKAETIPLCRASENLNESHFVFCSRQNQQGKEDGQTKKNARAVAFRKA